MPHRIERNCALPLDLLVDQAVFELELSEIWDSDWVFATVADAVAEPGDFVPVTIARQPVIISRGRDLVLRAFSNVCSHRGAPLVQSPGRGHRFACPYHAWSYNDDGSLASVPYSMPGEVDTSSLCLDSYRVEVWHGLVFVCVAGEPTQFDQRVSVVDPYLRQIAPSRFHHGLAPVYSEVWDANWKQVFVNAVDTYSHFRVHSETIEPTSPTDGTYYLAGSAEATVTGGESGDRADYLMVALPPSLVAVVFPDTMIWQAFTPIEAGLTRVQVGVASEDPGGSDPVRTPGWDLSFIAEDRSICELTQSNALARHQPGPLLSAESALGDFHEYLGNRLTGAPASPATVCAEPGDRPHDDDPFPAS